MDTRLVMQSLPLVAAVLGNKYGVTVNISGKDASTNGRVINLPSLPQDCDATLLGLARGYIDHESAHIRETDFPALKEARLTPLEKHLMNSIEDWRVENLLAEIFPGCRGNFSWLIRHFFLGDCSITKQPLLKLVPDWVLLTVRSWDVPEVAAVKDELQARIEADNPYLCRKLIPVLQGIRASCSSTADSIAGARQIVAILAAELRSHSGRSLVAERVTSWGGQEAPGEELAKVDVAKELHGLLAASADELPQNIGEILSEALNGSTSTQGRQPIRVAQLGSRELSPFPPQEHARIRQVESALKVRLQSTMQSLQLKKSCIGRRGRIRSDRLAGVVTSNPRLFIRHEERKGINTAVHILLDCSSSMNREMDLASKACFAIARALESIKGINVGVTSFPAVKNGGTAVSAIVAHGERVHGRFSTKCFGGTPMGEAIWWVLQQMILQEEPRKMMIVITDGQPDCQINATEAIQTGELLGMELFGVGIRTDSVKKLFKKKACRVNELNELAPAMYRLLSGALTNK